MTLANLCVAYIMISDNEKAEEVWLLALRGTRGANVLHRSCCVAWRRRKSEWHSKTKASRESTPSFSTWS
jgi:hypothetical protein